MVMDSAAESVFTQGGMTDALLSKSVVTPDKVSPQTTEIIQKAEDEYITSLFSVFSQVNEPIRQDEVFVPDFKVDENTTPTDVQTAVGEILKKGDVYYKEVAKTTAFSLPIEQQSTLYDRALAFVNGERSNSSSFSKAVEQMTDMAVFMSKIQLGYRVDQLYEKNGGDGKLILGRLLLGKSGTLSFTAEENLNTYQKDSEAHANKIKNLALTGIPKE